MNEVDNELDEYGKRALRQLRSAPPIDPQTAAEKKAKFLLLAENYRQEMVSHTHEGSLRKSQRNSILFQLSAHRPVMKALVATMFVLIVLVASSITVYASQGSLPGEPLYLIKSWSEDFQLSIISSPLSKLNLTLEFTNRRMGEITSLVKNGNELPVQATERYQSELDSALQLAAELENGQLKNALGQIKNQAENQGMNLARLINNLPEHAEPAIVHLQERLEEQVTLSTIGEDDPQSFRSEVHERQHRRSEVNKPTPSSQDSDTFPVNGTTTPVPTEDAKDHGNDKGKPTEAPNHGGEGNGQDKSTPEDGNRGHGPNSTPKP